MRSRSQKDVFAAVRHFYHKMLDEERYILFYYESFRFASFCPEPEGYRNRGTAIFAGVKIADGLILKCSR
jgi:hypothetical protein